MPPTSASSPSTAPSPPSSTASFSARRSPRAGLSQSGCQSVPKAVINSGLSCSSGRCCRSCGRGSGGSRSGSNSGRASSGGGSCDSCSCGTHARLLCHDRSSKGTKLSRWCNEGRPRFSTFSVWASQARWVNNNRCVAEGGLWFVVVFSFVLFLFICDPSLGVTSTSVAWTSL